MSSGWLATHINRIEQFGSKIGLFSEKGSGKIPFDGSELNNWTYERFWQESIKGYWFDVKLVDEGLFFFQDNSPERGDLRFSYLECPYEPKVSFEEFVDNSQDDDASLKRDLEFEYELIAPMKKEAFTPIRYEFRKKDFTPYVHPASHFHFGFNSEIRIGSFQKLTPFSFFLIVIRQCYPKAWKERVISIEAMRTETLEAFSENENVDKEFLGDQLKLDYYLKNGPTSGSSGN